MKLTSSPAMNCSTRTRSPAEPKTRSSKKSFSARSASSALCTTTTPLPEARPSTLKTHGTPIFRRAILASARVTQTSASAVGMPYFFMNDFEKTFEPSSSAASLFGPNTGSCRLASSSARPSVSGSSGPTTVRSTFIFSAKSASSTVSDAPIGRHVACEAIPGFPGAQKISPISGDCASFHAKACSRPPEPMTRTLMAGSQYPSRAAGTTSAKQRPRLSCDTSREREADEEGHQGPARAGHRMTVHPLETLLRQRIVILDGGMGTMIQSCRLDEAAYRGERFRDWSRDLKGNNDLLSLTRPEVVEEIH